MSNIDDKLKADAELIRWSAAPGLLGIPLPEHMIAKMGQALELSNALIEEMISPPIMDGRVARMWVEAALERARIVRRDDDKT